ncbi:unnamed protein product [Linum tenue]|uniref:Pentatricopeptide repeat-containing protein n=7 Tax=Linum tenue TaxID=586396 RepID=A0AAV0QCV8_9ROSI|nr:unnamed protein product [Linum tenue]
MSLWRKANNLRSIGGIEGERPSFSKLTRLLQLCSNSKSLNQGQQIHQHVIALGSSGNPFVVTKLVQMYADCDDLCSSRKLFELFPNPNVFAWTAILGFFSRHGMYEDCLVNYGLMKSQGVSADHLVFPKVLKACAQLAWLDGGTWVHGGVVVYGYERNFHVCNALIDMYAKCGNVLSGRLVFAEMGERDLFTWNSMISGYISNGLLDSAVQLFGGLKLEGIKPDVITFNMLMDAYFRMGLCDEASKVFEQIETPDIISWTTLISGYSRAGKYATCLVIFKDMVNEGGILPDVDSLSLVLVSCRHLRALMCGKAIHGYGIKTQQPGGRFYRSAGPALMTMYAKCDSVHYARTVFAVMDKSDVVAWNAMILAFVESESRDLALECFGEMQRSDIQNDQTTISTVLPVCDLKHGKQIHAYAMKHIFDQCVAVWNSVIHMYSTCGKVDTAYSVFTTSKIRDLVTWNAMIRGFGMHGLAQAALSLLQDMKRVGVCADALTFTSVLSACHHSGLVEEGIKLFESMTGEYGFVPTMEHYSCVVNMLARVGRLEAAINFIHQMPLEPDKSVWGALLAACLDQQNVEVGKLAAEKLIHLEPERAGHYVALSNIYAEAGRWDDAVKARKEMERRGSVKPSGQSWITFGN